MPQKGTPHQGPAYLPSHLAALGFTAITPAGQTLVQPIVSQPPLLAQAPPLSCQSQTPLGAVAVTAGRQVKENRREEKEKKEKDEKEGKMKRRKRRKK